MPTNTQRNKSHKAGKATVTQSPHRWRWSGRDNNMQWRSHSKRGSLGFGCGSVVDHKTLGSTARTGGKKSRQCEYRNPILEEGRGFPRNTEQSSWGQRFPRKGKESEKPGNERTVGKERAGEGRKQVLDQLERNSIMGLTSGLRSQGEN